MLWGREGNLEKSTQGQTCCHIIDNLLQKGTVYLYILMCPSNMRRCTPFTLGFCVIRLWQHLSIIMILFHIWFTVNLPGDLYGKKSSMQETQGRFLVWEDPLEKGKATHSYILSWRIPWIEGPGRLKSVGLQRNRHDWETNTFIFISNIWECGK